MKTAGAAPAGAPSVLRSSVVRRERAANAELGTHRCVSSTAIKVSTAVASACHAGERRHQRMLTTQLNL